VSKNVDGQQICFSVVLEVMKMGLTMSARNSSKFAICQENKYGKNNTGTKIEKLLTVVLFKAKKCIYYAITGTVFNRKDTKQTDCYKDCI